mgnify:CR=1 FL=1
MKTYTPAEWAAIKREERAAKRANKQAYKAGCAESRRERRERLSYAELTRVLFYSPETGLFTWRVSRGGLAVAGSQAGRTLGPIEAGIIKINGTNYRMHHLAWFYVYGQWPERSVRFIDGDLSNNKIENLREISNEI